MRRAFLPLCLCAVAVTTLTLTAATPQKNKCEGLLKAVADAQTAYGKALGAWKQATVKVIQAEAAAKEAAARLKANDKAQIAAVGTLEAAKADQAACASAEKDGKLAPLIDCSKVADRVRKAEADLARLEAANEALEDDLKRKEQQVEDREQDAANAHAAERQAWADLEAAKRAAAGCKIGQ